MTTPANTHEHEAENAIECKVIGREQAQAIQDDELDRLRLKD
jgi:hypothetical protein